MEIPILKWYLLALRKHAVFQGRATRREYLSFYLVNVLIVLGLSRIDSALGLDGPHLLYGLFSDIYMLALFVPEIAVTTRRLHDRGSSGWWQLVFLVPIIGPIIMLFPVLSASEPRDNRYGPYSRPARAVVLAEDGGPPFAVAQGRLVSCPWCGKSNPQGQETCQWCHKQYREASQAPS